MNELDRARLGLIPVLTERAPAGQIGRTALMKYMYFLQTLRGVPLRYSFTMYSYGPFDSEVLADLSSAEAMSIVKSSPVEFSGGYGYQIRPGTSAEFAKKSAFQFLNKHEKDITWLFATFGALNSSELELASTIVYVDREFFERNEKCSVESATNRVSDLKPHFTWEHVQK
ncbi:MAG: hypothetical protein ACHQ1H_11035, partial [Nitrososphaerales archaeon]